MYATCLTIDFLLFDRCDQRLFFDLKQKLNLTINFQQFLTMLIKLVNNAITMQDTYKAIMIMNSDGTGTLRFLKILEYKTLDQLSLTMKLGDTDVINKHVAHRFKVCKNQLTENVQRLDDIVAILKAKNPSLISQINKAAAISQPYHLRMEQAKRNQQGWDPTSGGNSFRSIKSKAISNAYRS